MRKLMLLASLSCLSVSLYAHSSELDFITNLPDAKTQVGFEKASDLRSFKKRNQTNSTPEKILDLANLRFADLDYDQCLSSSEYKMFLEADTLWKKAPEKIRDNQLRAFLNDYWIHAMYPGKKEEFYAALKRVEKTIPKNMIYVLWNSIIKGKWIGPDNSISLDEVKYFETSWQNFLKIPKKEVNQYLASKMHTMKRCETLPGPEMGKTVLNPIDSAKEIGAIIEGKLDTLKTIDQWTGKAGTASFFGGLYGKTKDKHYLNLSLKLFAEIEEEFIKAPQETGITMGSAGIGLSALYAYRVSGENKFLEIALRYADRSKLNVANDYAEGSAGIGIFKLNLYSVTKDPRWLKEAIEAGDLIVKSAVTSGKEAYWPMRAEFPAVFAGFGHGSAGIGYYLINLYELTKNEIYRTYAYKAAEHVLKTAYHDEKGNLHWTWYQPPMGYGSAWKYQWSHGNFGILYFWDALRRITPDKKWNLAFRHTMAPALAKGINYRFDEGTQCCGKAGQGDLYLTLYRETGDDHYLSLAKNAANYLVDQNGRVRETFGRDKAFYDMSYSGIAGIGFYFLQLDKPEEVTLPYQLYAE